MTVISAVNDPPPLPTDIILQGRSSHPNDNKDDDGVESTRPTTTIDPPKPNPHYQED
jgi:hypothetical protein